MFKEILKIKDDLEEKGYSKDIPIEVFARTIMVKYGMKRDTVARWLRYYEENKFIHIDNLKVNFL